MNQIASAPDELRRRLQAALEENPSKMTSQLAREQGVPEVEIMRALPEDRAVELDASRSEELLRAFETLGDVHVIVTNSSVTCEVVGGFGNFSTWGEFFNVQTKTLDLHIRWQQLAAVFAVEKPSHMNDEVRTLSFQFFDATGAAALKIFLNFGSRPTPERSAAFTQLRQRFQRRR